LARRGDHRRASVACWHRGSLEQRGLPDPGLAAHDEGATVLPDRIDQAAKLSPLVASADKLGNSLVSAGARQVDLRVPPAALTAVVAACPGACGPRFSRMTQAMRGTCAYRRGRVSSDVIIGHDVKPRCDWVGASDAPFGRYRVWNR
jgi:hypothetical protein